MARSSNGAIAEAQLTLEVVSSLDEELPIAGTLRISGALRVDHDLNKDEVLHVQVFRTRDGEAIAAGNAEVESVALITKRTETSVFVERRHSSKIASA